METKKCPKCGQIKDIDEFWKDAKSIDKHSRLCIECKKKDKIEYYHTKKGLVTRIYCSQKSHSKRRNHPNPSYSKKELWSWLNSNEIKDKLDKLHSEWVQSGYDKNKIPSIDRLNNSLPYSFDNIQLTTWGKNNKKGRISKKVNLIRANKKTGRISKGINLIGVEKKTGKIIDLTLASNLALNRNAISSNENDITNNFYWEYK